MKLGDILAKYVEINHQGQRNQFIRLVKLTLKEGNTECYVKYSINLLQISKFLRGPTPRHATYKAKNLWKSTFAIKWSILKQFHIRGYLWGTPSTYINTFRNSILWHNTKIYPFPQDLNNKVKQNQQSNIQFADSALQTSLECLLMEDQETHTGQVTNVLPSHQKPTHWLLSQANSHTLEQQSEE